jgi:arsenate reductase-like glutaredoxin family protein
MASDSFWHKWKLRLLALFFIAQYHLRMTLLDLRFKARSVSHADINARARVYWNNLCQALTAHTVLKSARQTFENEQVTAALRRLTKQKLEGERLRTALNTAKKRLESVVFTEESPTQPLDLSKLKTAWHSLETSKIPRVTPDKLKTAWRSFETGTLPRIAPKKLKAVRHPWKTLKTLRHPNITLFTLGTLSFLLVGLFILSGMASQTLNTIKTVGISTTPQFFSSELNPAAQRTTNINASKSLARLSQLDANEYASQSEYDTWAYSACSTASMTEVFNAYGHHYRITDVLKVESSIGEITPQLGLVENVGIANTAARFGFQTNWGNNWTLDQVKSNANAGHPVIVGWPPYRYDGGHIVVVVGGDADNIYLADSSLWNRHTLTNAQFMQWWAGFAAVVTPE